MAKSADTTINASEVRREGGFCLIDIDLQWRSRTYVRNGSLADLQPECRN